MKKISSLILLSAALTCSGNALAEWQEIGKTDLFTVFVDPATLQKQGNPTQIMSMLDFKKPGQNPKTKENVNSIIGLNEFDCSAVKYRPIEFKVFSAVGTAAVANPGTAVSLASTAATGKSPLEHAASAATKKECSFFNVIDSKPICIEAVLPSITDNSELFLGPADSIQKSAQQ